MKTKLTQNNIPDGWQAKKLADLFEFKNGLNKEKKFFGHGTPIINYMDINRGGGLYKDNIFGRVEVNESELARFNVSRGDVFFTRTSETLDEIGFSAVALDNFENTVFSGFVLRARPKVELLLPEYSQYCFRAQSTRKEIIEKSSYTTRALTSGTLLNHVTINLPPLSEQKRIVAVLETWDEAIERLTKKIEIKKEIKKGLTQELLTGKTRLRGFSSAWDSYVFSDIALPRKERLDPKNMTDNKVCIDLEHLEQGSGRLLGGGNVADTLSLKTIYKSGDVLFGKLRAYLRKYWLATSDGLCSTEIWALKANREVVIPEILFQIIQSEKFIATATMSQGTHMPRSSWEIVSGYEVSLPQLMEQKAIANILSTADKEISELEQKLILLKEQKKYLLNNLITGAIRTPETISQYQSVC